MIIVRHRMDDVMPFDEKYYVGASADIMAKYAPLWTKGIKNFFLKREALLIREKFWKQYRADAGGTIKKNMLEHYARLGRYAAENRIRVILISDRCPEGYEAVCTAAGTEADKQKWELLDPNGKADFSSPDMVIPGDGHPSAHANLVLARLIHGRLSEGR